MEEYCPTLYIYNDEDDFRSLYDSLYLEIDDTTYLSFYPILTGLVAGSHEAHFGVGSKDDPFLKGFYDGTFSYSPVDVIFLEDRAHVYHNFSPDTSLKRGDEIISINGNTVEEIRNRIMPHIFADGEIISYRIDRLSDMFPAMYFWYMEKPDTFAIQFRSLQSGDTGQVVLNSMTLGEKRAVYSERNPQPSEEIADTDSSRFYELEIENSTAYLKLKTFYWKVAEDLELDAAEFYQELFKKFSEEKTENLIIDLRDNRGGRYEFGNEILPYVNKHDRKGIFQESVSWKGKATQYELPERSDDYFRGDIYVIINAETYSTGSNLAKYLREFGGAILIGQESGSRYEGFAAGSEEIVHLPNSRIRVSIPRYWIKSPISDKQDTSNRGVLPDYEVSYTIQEILNEADKEKELAYRLIREKEGMQ